MAETITRFGCPRCGSERIAEWNTVLVPYEVTEWTEDGAPLHYDAGTPAWDTAEVVKDSPPFGCRECGEGFDKPARLSVEVLDA